MALELWQCRFDRGLGRTMALSVRISWRLCASGLVALSCAGFPLSPVRAEQVQPVETYYNQSLGQPVDTVLPEGVEWNKPIQPGQLKLPQDDTQTTTKKKTSKGNSRLPVGDMQAPQMNSSIPLSNSALSKRSPGLVASPGMELGQPGAAANSLGAPQNLGTPSSKNSAANLMLMQGMKNALKQAGGEVPSSSAPTSVATDAASQDITQVPLSATAAAKVPSDVSAAPTTEADENVTYQVGRGPKSLSVPAGHATAPLAAPVPVKAAASTLAPEPEAAEDKEALSAAAPVSKKDQLPADLPFAKDSSPAPVAAPVKPELRSVTDDKAQTGQTSVPSSVAKKTVKAAPKPTGTSSIFGPPVDEAVATTGPDTTADGAAPEKRAAHSNLNATSVFPEAPAAAPVAPVTTTGAETSETLAAPTPEEPTCTPESKPWTRSCAEVGYPSTYQGQIAGETKTECPGGSVHDIWLSNTCGPTAKTAEKPASEPKAEKPKKAVATPKAAPVAMPVEKSKPKTAAAVAPVAAEKPPVDKSVAEPVVEKTAPAPIKASQSVKTNDGACGLAAEIPAETKPMAYLCRTGQASAVVGSGPWRWNCAANLGGKIATCETPMKPTAPEKQEEKETAPQAMSSSDHETAASPVAPAPVPAVEAAQPTTPAPAPAPALVAPAASALQQPSALDGRCGLAHGQSAAMPPVKDLCETGSPGVITQNPDGTAWIWVCEGAMGADTASCSAPVTMSGAALKQHRAPTSELKPSIDGRCGSAAGRPSAQPPSRDERCAAGAVTDVSGMGPWMWQCIGSSGGQTVACQAPVPAARPEQEKPQPPKLSSEKAGVLGTLDKADSTQAMPKALPTPPKPSLAADLAIPEAPQPPLLAPASATQVPANPSLDTTNNVPLATPSLPDDVKEVPPPALQDGLQTPSLPETLPQPSSSGSPLVLDSDMSSLSFDELRTGLTSDSQQTLNKVAVAMARKPGSRLTLIGYAASGNNGSSPREARQISLQRVLAVRDYLVGKGVASNRLDVRALGANVPSGNMDRVDLKAN